ncbi:glycosyltransferase [Saccharopolyspora indica]|uniref:glycosyltransferase n=1 Tax=Saccharopolyspora indica TaxID=1229659 RepID=UPI0022EAB7A7|nr:glycosyltransferase [Saccharopolyspora indica]MDA3643941.1 glycosyltransferase [Saccharopolyspora indica]
MKALLMTLGTRGDVQPFLALARGLADAGHEAVVVAPHRFAGFAADRGVPFAGVDDGPMRQLDGDTAGAVVQGGARARLRQVRTMPAMFAQVLEDCWAAAARDADVVVHNGQIIAGQHVAEALGVPAVLALPLPMYVPTREFAWPAVSLPGWVPGAVNRASYAGMKLPALMFHRVVDRWRARTLQLPPRPGRHDPLRRPDGGPAPVLHAFSPAVLPTPADWPDSAVTTGYWNLPSAAEPLPVAVEEFLAQGAPPVYAGFGSMSGLDPARTGAVVLAAARRAGRRLVAGTGWGGMRIDQSSDDVLVVDDVDHAALFPRTAAIVHHGGAGTTGAAFAAGRPQVVCPFVADQPFWGGLTARAGVGTAPIAQKRLTADALARAITEAVTSQPLNDSARAIGERVRSEDGVRAAVGVLERIAA